MVKLEHLQELFDDNDVNCSACNENKRELVVQSQHGIASHLRLACVTCDKKHHAARIQCHRYRIKRKQLQRDANTFKKEYNRISVKVHRTEKMIKSYKQASELKRNNIQNGTIQDNLLLKVGRVPFLDFEVNLRAVLLPFQLGLGGSDIAKMLAMFGLRGSLSFETNFTRNSAEIMSKIRTECDLIIQEALGDEIIEALKIKENDEAAVKDWNLEIDLIKNKKFEDLPESLGPHLLTVSYDMGWQKRSTGRNYDSLSGHGFYVGYSSGKVVRAGVLQKNVVIVLLIKVSIYRFPSITTW